MSDTTNDDATQGASEDEAASQPATTTAPAPGTEQSTPTEDDQKPAEPLKPDPRDRAIRQLAFEAREAKRQAAEARHALEQAVPRDPTAPPSQADLERIIEERVAQAIDLRDQQAKSEAWIAKGNVEYPDFTERCNALAAMGAGSNPAFMASIAKLPDGQKLIAELSTNAGEADRILRMQPVDMAVELAMMSQRIASNPTPPPRPTTQAPPPIRPITGSARAEPDPSKMDGDEYLAYFRKQRAAKSSR